MNLFSRLFDGVDNPGKLAIETAEGGAISYGDLVARAGRVANVLVERGVQPGDRVAAQTEKSVEALDESRTQSLLPIDASGGDEDAPAP